MLHGTGQNKLKITNLESLDTRVKLSKELIENDDIGEVFQSMFVFIYFYDILSQSV